MTTPTIGTVLGIVAESETLAGWEIVATGDGGAITMKSGSCWGRYGDWDGPAEVAWQAVTARLWAKLSDVDLSERIEEYGAQSARAYAEGKPTLGIDAALNACIGEFERRQALKAVV